MLRYFLHCMPRMRKRMAARRTPVGPPTSIIDKRGLGCVKHESVRKTHVWAWIVRRNTSGCRSRADEVRRQKKDLARTKRKFRSVGTPNLHTSLFGARNKSKCKYCSSRVHFDTSRVFILVLLSNHGHNACFFVPGPYPQSICLNRSCDREVHFWQA